MSTHHIILFSLVVCACGTGNPTVVAPVEPAREPRGTVTTIDAPPALDAAEPCPFAMKDPSACALPPGSTAEALLEKGACLHESGNLVEALRATQRALETGIQERKPAVMRDARVRAKELLDLIPHLTFRAPANRVVTVSFDGRSISPEAITKSYAVDPGPLRVIATDGVRTFVRDLCVAPKDSRTVDIVFE